MNQNDEKQEIIIIKRSGDHGDSHHGGAWKIAFADFMTAMMALFLVLWLVNAANEETKKSVASYFNPVKLVDRNRSTKGLDDMSGGPLESSEPSEETADGAKSEKDDDEETELSHTDEQLQENPYRVLDEIANDDTETALVEVATDSPDAAAPVQRYLDPFAPDFWNKEASRMADAAEAGDEDTVDQPADQALKTAALADEGENSASKSVPDEEPSETTSPQDSLEENETDDDSPVVEADQQTESSDETKEPEKVEPAPKPDQVASDIEQPENNETLDEIKKAVEQAFGQTEPLAGGLSVEQVNEGVMISITDQFGWSMFKIGSSVPRRDLVLAMEKISRILSEQDGKIRLRGHTDGRQFAGDEFGNWRLSATRAQTAYHMLVRAGFDGKRVSQITGFADRRLKTPSDPYAAANRRIEILLEVN